MKNRELLELLGQQPLDADMFKECTIECPDGMAGATKREEVLGIDVEDLNNPENGVKIIIK
jgi:hypothetical protein